MVVERVILRRFRHVVMEKRGQNLSLNGSIGFGSFTDQNENVII